LDRNIVKDVDFMLPHVAHTSRAAMMKTSNTKWLAFILRLEACNMKVDNPEECTKILATASPFAS